MIFKTDSIGHIVRGDWSFLHDILFNHGATVGFLSLLTLLAGIALLVVLSLPVGYFLHRKHIPTGLFLFFSLFLIFMYWVWCTFTKYHHSCLILVQRNTNVSKVPSLSVFIFILFKYILITPPPNPSYKKCKSGNNP